MIIERNNPSETRVRAMIMKLEGIIFYNVWEEEMALREILILSVSTCFKAYNITSLSENVKTILIYEVISWALIQD